MNKDYAVMGLTFAAGVLTLLSGAAFLPTQYQPVVLFGVAVINLGLGVFFGVKQPVNAALRQQPPK